MVPDSDVRCDSCTIFVGKGHIEEEVYWLNVNVVWYGENGKGRPSGKRHPYRLLVCSDCLTRGRKRGALRIPKSSREFIQQHRKQFAAA